MTHGEEFKSLQDFLAKLLVEAFIGNELFEKYHTSLAKCISLLQFGYETGAVLGYARGSKLALLNKMLSVQDMVFDHTIKDMQKSEKKRLDDFIKKHEVEPDTFSDFIYWPLWESTTGLTINYLFKPSDTETRERKQKRMSDIIQKKLWTKIPLEEAQSRISLFIIKGLSFGSAFPELTAEMFNNVYARKKKEEKLWNINRSHGFATPIDLLKRIGFPETELPPPTLEENNRKVLGTVAYYVSQYYPELLDPLDLSYYLYLIENEKI